MNQQEDKINIDDNISLCDNDNMNQEYEVKFLDIDVPKIEERLKSMGAVKVGDLFYHSCVFDYPGFPLDNEYAWLRLRDEGDKVMLAYKKRLGVKSSSGDDEGIEEIETEVSNFESTFQILLKIGMIIKFEQEKKRTRWKKDNVVFDIDTWPRLNPYLEVESSSEEEMEKGIEWLGLDKKEAKKFSATQVYEMNGIRDKDYVKLTFKEFVKRG